MSVEGQTFATGCLGERAKVWDFSLRGLCSWDDEGCGMFIDVLASAVRPELNRMRSWQAFFGFFNAPMPMEFSSHFF